MTSALAVVAADSTGKVLAGCIAYLRSPIFASGFLFAITNLDGYAVWNEVQTPFTGVLQMAGACQYYEQPVSVTAANVTLRVGKTPSNPQDVQLPPCVPFKKPAVVPRPPLPAFPPGAYDRVLPWTPPMSRDFLRADAWGVEVPGLPVVPRGSSEHPERFISYLAYKYQPADLQRALVAYASRGYTHLVCSWPDARSDGGQSLEQFVDHCLHLKSVAPYVHVKLASKDFDARDQTPLRWTQQLAPVMDALMKANAVDEFGVWEWNLFNVPGAPTIQTFTQLGQFAHDGGCSFWAHFSPEKTSWFADGDPRGRFGFWEDLGSDVDGLDYQADPSWDVPMLQARLVDTLKQFAMQGQQHRMRAFELTASLQFSQDHPNEDEANLTGYLACCTNAPAQVWGYGNGARRPDGSLL